MCPGTGGHRGAENHASSGHRIVTGALCTAPGALCTATTRCTLHCTNPLEMPLTQSKCIPAEQTSKYQERETGALLKLLILVRASQSRSSRIKSYQMHFPSSVNGSLLTPSFLRGDCPKAHAITEQPLRSHVRYCGFHNSCKQAPQPPTCPPWPPATCLHSLTYSAPILPLALCPHIPMSSAVPSLTIFTYLSFSKACFSEILSQAFLLASFTSTNLL